MPLHQAVVDAVEDERHQKVHHPLVQAAAALPPATAPESRQLAPDDCSDRPERGPNARFRLRLVQSGFGSKVEAALSRLFRLRNRYEVFAMAAALLDYGRERTSAV
jgi:hypothetical protein